MLPCGRVYKRKTRLCGRGDRECKHRDFDPMAISAVPVRFASILMCFSIAAQLGLNCTSIDFSAAYTNVPMKRETWIYVPEGIEGIPTHSKDGQCCIAKVCNALFASRQVAQLGLSYLTPSCVGLADLNSHIQMRPRCQANQFLA
jgi:hypothetical protein